MKEKYKWIPRLPIPPGRSITKGSGMTDVSLAILELLRNRIRGGEFLWFPEVSSSTPALPIQEARSVSRVAWPLDPETVAFTTFGEGAVGSDPDRPSGFQGLMPWRRSSR